jgi:hypothetical protein
VVASKYQRYYEQGLGLCARKGFGGLDRPAFPGECDLELINYRFMKSQTSRMCLFASLGAASLVALSATAQTQAPSTTTTATPVPAVSAPATLPYGAGDILKLSRAQVGEEVTLNFIRNSGTIYNLAPNDIVYLHNEGVSDRVISAMLDQRRNVPADMAAQTAASSAPASAPAPVYQDPNAAAAAQASAQYYAQPAPAYAQPEATYAPASTVYTVPYSSPDYYPYYYGGYPYYYGGYPYYYGPSIGIGFGFGGGRYYGGGYRGGGFHGGGFGGGGHGGGFGGGGHGGSGGHH